MKNNFLNKKSHPFYKLTILLFLLCINFSFSQTQSTEILAKLNSNTNRLSISQKIIFKNYSKDTLREIYLHNWMNGYKNKNTPLSKRLLEDYDKRLYFAKDKNKGYSTISSIKINANKTDTHFEEFNNDLIKIKLDKQLYPNDTVIINANYQVKIPNDKFTRYGFSKNGFNLKYWYLSPVVYHNGWQTMNNYNLDDMYCYVTDFNITFEIPRHLELETNLIIQEKANSKNKTTYLLKEKNQIDAEIIIFKKNNFNYFTSNEINLATNLNKKQIDNKLASSIFERQISFIEDNLGKYPHKKLLLNKITYDKNPVYGLNQLPSILNPFDNVFKYDLKLFKVLTNNYIKNTLPINKRNNNKWINDGLQTYLMVKYIEKYYPEKKAIGRIADIWGIRSYKIAQLDFNDKYAFVYQFAMRKNIDQALNTRSDSLSTFNRKIINKYKAGLGLIYLDDYLKNNILKKSIKEYYLANILSTKINKSFSKIINSKTSNNLDWFFNDYLTTNKKIDYKIKKITQSQDSLIVSIKNKSDFNAPITLYGIKDKEIKYKKWVKSISDFKDVKILKGDFDRISLNYESKYPEINLNNNWKKVKPSLFNKPLQFKFIKDVDNPYYNQVFYNIEYDYNYYDGVILGLKLSNKTLFEKKWNYSIKPTLGLKNKKLNGALKFKHVNYPKYNKIYSISSGFSYSSNNYAPNLKYEKISPFFVINYKRKSLRDVGGKHLSARYLVIKKEIHKDSIKKEFDNYNILNVKFSKYKPDIINNFKHNFDLQIAKKFSKIAFEIQYRKLQKNNTQIDLRFFAGSFIHNNTSSTFFDFSLNRPSDYLFDYNYFGRSEDTGFLSQQIIIAEGGFKSIFKENTANKWMLSSNNSIGLWRWFEIYGDVSIYKNRYFKPQLKYDSGVRFNFVQNIFEIYLPLQSSNGFEPKQKNYTKKIRFVLTLSLDKVYNFIKRGFY